MKKIISLCLSLVGVSLAQVVPQPLPEIEHLQGNNYLFSWQGVPGRVYFVQTSSQAPTEDGFIWEFAPDIRLGMGDILEMGFEADPEKSEFFRLVYFDYVGSEDIYFADFDGDGYSNLQEAMENTDPFDPESKPTSPRIYRDSDGDGISDQDEYILGLDPHTRDEPDSSQIAEAGPLLISRSVSYEYKYDTGGFYEGKKGTGTVKSMISQEPYDPYRISSPWALAAFHTSFDSFAVPKDGNEIDRYQATVQQFNQVKKLLPRVFSQSRRITDSGGEEKNNWEMEKTAHMLKLPFEAAEEKKYQVLAIPRYLIEEHLVAAPITGPADETEEENRIRVFGIVDEGVHVDRVRVETFTIDAGATASNILEFEHSINEVRENLWTIESTDLLTVDLAVDTDRSGTVDRSADSADEDKWTKERGAIYAVNFDRDGNNAAGGENRPDAIHFADDGSSSDEDWDIEDTDEEDQPTIEDEKDIAPIVIASMEGLPADFKVFLKAEEAEDMRAIHLFKKIEAGETAIWGSHRDPTAPAAPGSPAPPWIDDDDDLTDNLIEITKWVNPNATDYEETRDSGSGDYTFGIEGLVLRGMEVDSGTLDSVTGNAQHAGKFSGELQYSMEIRDKDDNVVATDISPVRLRVAPWLMISRDESSEEIWAADLGAENDPFRNEPLNGRYAGLDHSGQLNAVATGLRWFQDHLEIGFTQRPGGPKTHMVCRVPYDRGAGSSQPNWPVEHLLKKDVGIFQIGIDGNGSGAHAASGNYGGNLEVLTPNTTNPLGLVMMGNNASDKMKAFFEAQEFQQDNAGSFSARGDWLIVGHIDEYTSFLSGGRIFISGARQAIELLQSEIPTADRAKRVFFATSGNTLTGSITTDTAAADDPATPLDETRLIHTGRNHITEGDTYQWIRFYDGNAKGHVAKVKLHDGFLEVEDIPRAGAKAIFYTGKSINEYDERAKKSGIPDFGGVEEHKWLAEPKSGDGFVLVEDTKFWAPGWDNTTGTLLAFDHNNNGMRHGMPAFITVKEILDDSGTDNFVQFNRFDLQGVINDDGESSIRAAAGSVEPRFIPVPSLFFGHDLPTGTGVKLPYSDSDGNPFGSVAFSPGPTNLQPVNGSLYVPRQFGPRNAAGEDIFEKEIRNTVQETVYFVDCWNSYHRALGEAHCGSNVKRTVPSWDWWEKINE